MAKKVFTFVVGILLLTPCFMALCCDSILFVTFAMVYGVVLWYSPKFSTRIRKFWLEFWKINARIISYNEVR